jgi:hypothetical protein
LDFSMIFNQFYMSQPKRIKEYRIFMQLSPWKV